VCGDRYNPLTMSVTDRYDIIVIGGGHAGAEAAWAGANLGLRTALVTMNPAKIGAMSCNPAIGGLAKGQIVREIDALGGLMGRAIDATGIQFRVLNASKGPAVHGPRAQADKYRYAKEVQRLLATRNLITIVTGTVERFLIEADRVIGVGILSSSTDRLGATGHPGNPGHPGHPGGPGGSVAPMTLRASAVVLTTGTFMRGLMHTGERQEQGGRVGEPPATGISATLQELGFELGRLKTGTPPRLAAGTIDFNALEPQSGDDRPVPFSDLTDPGPGHFPVAPQRLCHITHTTEQAHDLIRANLHRAPMYNGQVQTAGPRYCPSIEDKVVRFADRHSHHVYLEPESLETNEVYPNGISTSLPDDVQEQIVRMMPGCGGAKILRYGYAVEYDMVRPHQIDTTCMTKRVAGLFLAGQINGTSGYEEAAGQGLVAGLNAARYVQDQPLVSLGRDQAYIGVMLDDLVTKTPLEPYRMFTSRAEFRLLLRSDNASRRLTPLGRQWGLVHDRRWKRYQQHMTTTRAFEQHIANTRVDGQTMKDWLCRPTVSVDTVIEKLTRNASPTPWRDRRLVTGVLADLQYAGYIERQHRQIKQLASQEGAPLPVDFDYDQLQGLRNEARQTLAHFRPVTLGQAGRLAGVTPADVMVLSVAMAS